MKLEFEAQPWMLVLGAFLAGLLVGSGPLVQVRRDSDGDGDTSIIISIGIINVNPVNFNDNSRNIPVDSNDEITEKDEA